MPLVTLIGEKLAKENLEFIYLGPNNECKNCKLKTACFNLKKGGRYRIKKIRDKHHDCSVYEKGVRVVEVEELPLIAAVDTKFVEGATLKIDTECPHRACDNYMICNPMAIQRDKKYTVAKIIEKIDCPVGKKLNKVELRE